MIPTRFLSDLVQHISLPLCNYPSYAWIPSDFDEAYKALEFVKSKTKPYSYPKFLEAGSGVAVISAMAKSMGMDELAVDINPKLVELNEECFRVDAKQGDILEFPNYKDFDVIYFFKPIFPRSKEAIFEKKVADEAKVGCWIINHSPEWFYPFNEDKRFRRAKSFEGMRTAIFRKKME
jgi:SAM-dependent methyltransferase